MATILRRWSYEYPPLYNNISRLAALPLGGERQFRCLPLQGLEINQDTRILDLCCGWGQTTAILVELSQQVTGLDVSPVSLTRARELVPQAQYVEGLAQNMPLPDQEFDLVHTSVALHEMTQTELAQIVQEVYRVLKPGGIFTFIDFHRPGNFLFWPGLALFFWLFETDTAWQLLNTDLEQLLNCNGFIVLQHRLYLGGSLQVIQAQKENQD